MKLYGNLSIHAASILYLGGNPPCLAPFTEKSLLICCVNLSVGLVGPGLFSGRTAGLGVDFSCLDHCIQQPGRSPLTPG